MDFTDIRTYQEFPTETLVLWHRIAKTKLRPFFANPRAMQTLRLALNERQVS